MANRPANAGSGGVGLGRGVAPTGDVASANVAPTGDVAPPGAVAPRPPAGHRATRPRPSRDAEDAGTSGLAWLPYLAALAGVAAGMLIASRGSKYAGWGTGLVGAWMLAAALARLVLPARYAGLLASRRKASDALAFAVFDTAVLAVALTLP